MENDGLEDFKAPMKAFIQWKGRKLKTTVSVLFECHAEMVEDANGVKKGEEGWWEERMMEG